MSFDKFQDIESSIHDRREAVARSIRIINPEELKKLADEIFRSPDDPWKEKLLRFIAENPGATFHHADAGQGVIFLYLADRDKGLWWLPGSGMGILSARGRQIMSDAMKRGG